MNAQLLTRDDFRASVFNRDRDQCVICGNNAADAHHIMERRLFTEPYELGGYFLDNGASVCPLHHLDCETTKISPDEVRQAASISKVILPDHLYDDQTYDKWGNVMLPNGKKMKGELFHDESVQKALASVLHLFTPYVKYPRTHHVPWSPGATDDDRKLRDMKHFLGKQVVVTKKMDGEQLSMYRDHCHARSLDSLNHPSRNWSKNFHGRIAHDIPDGWRVCAENLYAKHSIGYDDLKSFVLAFSIWDEKNCCLPWHSSLEWFSLIGLEHVDVLYHGIYNPIILHDLEASFEPNDEGYVIRTADGFRYGDFKNCVAKWVRPNHVQTSHGWKVNWIPNKMIPP